MSIIKSITILLLFFIVGKQHYLCFSQKQNVYVIDKCQVVSEKEAIIILPGFGDSKKGRKKQKDFFSNKGYDLFIPVYSDRKSLEKCVENIFEFYDKYKISKYKKVHIFSYILGAWTINQFIIKYGKKNISTIVYDRSPIQERAPYIVSRYLTIPVKIKFGPIMKNLSDAPYPSISNDSLNLGIIIESKATQIMRMFKNKTLKMGEIYWDVDSLHQNYDDYCYTWLNHDQMYERFDVVGNEILFFIENGKFTNVARREKYNWNPFIPYKKEKINK